MNVPDLPPAVPPDIAAMLEAEQRRKIDALAAAGWPPAPTPRPSAAYR